MHTLEVKVPEHTRIFFFNSEVSLLVFQGHGLRKSQRTVLSIMEQEFHDQVYIFSHFILTRV